MDLDARQDQGLGHRVRAATRHDTIPRRFLRLRLRHFTTSELIIRLLVPAPPSFDMIIKQIEQSPDYYTA